MTSDVMRVRWTKLIQTAKDNPLRFRIASEGDSWFAFAFKGAALDGQVVNLARKPVLHVDLATSGDTSVDVFRKIDKRLLRKVLKTAPEAGVPMGLLLLSAGGNDLFGDSIKDYITADPTNPEEPADWIVQDTLGKRLEIVKSMYRDVIAYRDTHSGSTHIVIHTYDYLARLGADTNERWWGSPWIYPLLMGKGLTDPAMQRKVARLVLDRLCEEVLLPLAGPGISVVDTRGTLQRLGKSVWQDELHPNVDGYAALAGCFLPELKARLPSVF